MDSNATSTPLSHLHGSLGGERAIDSTTSVLLNENIPTHSCETSAVEQVKRFESQSIDNKTDDNFLMPTCKPKKAKKRTFLFPETQSAEQLDSIELYQPTSVSTENLSSSSKQWSSKDIKDDIFANWGSMLELREHYKSNRFMDGAYSEPSLNKNFCEVSSSSRRLRARMMFTF